MADIGTPLRRIELEPFPDAPATPEPAPQRAPAVEPVPEPVEPVREPEPAT